MSHQPVVGKYLRWCSEQFSGGTDGGTDVRGSHVMVGRCSVLPYFDGDEDVCGFGLLIQVIGDATGFLTGVFDELFQDAASAIRGLRLYRDTGENMMHDNLRSSS